MKLLIGGSPCTHWSIAQTKHRETTAEGIGWELFLNYRIARDNWSLNTEGEQTENCVYGQGGRT